MKDFGMKKVFFFLTFLCFSIAAFAQQTTVTGKVVDASNNEALPDVEVTIENTAFTVTTDAEGNFNFDAFEIPLGEQIVRLEKQGYSQRRYPVVINEGEVLDLDILSMEVDINEENFQIGTISLSDNELNNEESTADNLSGLLQASRDVFLNAASFDFSATFFNPRGYDSQRGKVLINGIEMNKMYNGRPQWSNWGGLNDAQRNQVFSMGMSANEYTFGDLAGTTNIIMRASQYREGGRVSYAASNRSYRGRVMASYNTGLMKGGWAFSFLASRRFADEGFREGTLYDANSFFASVEKQLGEDHSLNFTAFYTPNRRGKSSASTQEVYDIKGTQYNSYWGYQNGEIRNSRVREIEEPVIMLNHYWDITNKTRLNTNLSYQFGKVGNSRLGYDDVRNPDPAYYQDLPSYELAQEGGPDYATAYEKLIEFQNNGQIDWASFYQTNTDDNGNGINSRYYLYEDRNDDKQISANTILTSDINEHITLNSRLSYRGLDSHNFANMIDLLGGSGYLDIDSFNDVPNDVNNPNRIVGVDDTFRYNYKLTANEYEGFAQAQFKYNKVDFYLAGNIGQTNYQREGLYQSGNFEDNSLGKSKELNFTTYGAKAGATYKLTGRHLINVNGSYFTDAPTLRNTFSNSRYTNTTVTGITEQKTQNIDVSYIFRSPTVKARLTGYYTKIQDASEISFYFADGIASLGREVNSNSAFVQEVLTGLDKRHIGAELGIEAQVTPTIKLKGAAAFGQYTYDNNPDLYLTSDDFATLESDVINERGEYNLGKSYLKDYKIAGGPQQAYQIGFEYRDPDYWWFGATTNFFSHAYVDVSPVARTRNFYQDVDGAPFDNYDPAVARDLLKQEDFGEYMLVNVVGGKSWKVDDYFIGFFATINNVFDEEYKTGGYEQGRYSTYQTLLEDTSREKRQFGPKYWYGYGTTYYLNVYVRF